MTDFFSVSDNDFGFRNTEIQQIYVRNKNGANVYWFNRKKTISMFLLILLALIN